MNKTKIALCIVAFGALFTSCAKSVKMKALEPAAIDRASKTKKISVAYFKNDSMGLSSKIEAKLSGVNINNKPYFTVISRNDFKKITKEQSIQSSGLIDSKNSVNIGNLLGAQAIISGNVHRPSLRNSYYYKDSVKCRDLACTKFMKYKIRCTKQVVGMSAEIRMVDVEKGDIIYAETLSEKKEYDYCRGDGNTLPSRNMSFQNLANSLAQTFVNKLTPHYRNFEVVLLSSPDIKYSSKEKELLSVAISYIESSRYKKAEKFLENLIDSTNSKSYVAFYDLGVVKEAQGEYKEAKEYYEFADNLMIKPVDEINEAMKRITDLINKRERMRQQISN